MNKAACAQGIVIERVECRMISSTATQLQPPRAAILQEPQTVDQGSSIRLHCDVNGSPRPTIRWTKDGVIGFLSPGTIDGIEFEDDSLAIWINSASSVHAGTYHCLAVNVAGFDTIDFEVALTGNK